MIRRNLLVSLLLIVTLLMPVAPVALADDPEPDPVGFCDYFGGTELDPGWNWIDPLDECAASLTAVPYCLEITSPAPDAHILTESAPRLLQPVTGNFVAQTKVICPEDGVQGPGAGLLVYQDNANYFGLFLGDWPRKVRAESRVAGAFSSWESADYAHNTAFLKVSRSANTFLAQYSQDDVTWTTLASVSFTAQHQVDVGLYVNDWRGNGGRGLFDYFVVKGCPRIVDGEHPANPRQVEARAYPPIIAPGARFPVRWVATGGQAVAETYIMWDTASHELHKDYPHRTEPQSGAMDAFVDHIVVPDDAETVYFTPYALMDAEIIYGPQENQASTVWAQTVGGQLQGLDGSGQYWHPDRESDFSPVWYQFVGGDRATTEDEIAGTDEDWIYQTQRQGVERFSIWLGGDVYELNLELSFLMAEFDQGAPGERVFDIIIEPDTAQEVVITDVDVVDLAGAANTAVTLTQQCAVMVEPGVDEHLEIAFEGDEAILNGLVIRGLRGVPVYKVSRLLGTGDDDTYTDPSGTHTNATEVWLGGNEQYHGGFRFPALYIPRGVVIRDARLDVTASANSTMSTTLDIFAHAVDSSPSFASQAVVPNRPRTDAWVDWEIPGGNWRTGTHYQSPNLAPVIQEVVDRPDWAAANALSLLLIAGQGHSGAPRKVYAQEGSYVNRAGLTLYYSLAEDMPTPTPTATPSPTATLSPTATATPSPTATIYPPPPPTVPVWRAYLPAILK